MKGLLIKDFKLLKGQKNFFLALIIIAFVIGITSPENPFPLGFLGLVGAMFSLSSISYDEFDNGSAFLFSLPISRKDYILEKYVFGILLGLIFLSIGALICFVIAMMSAKADMFVLLLTTLTMIPLILLILAIMLPFVLKFGSEKGRIAIMGLSGLIFVSIVLFSKAVEWFGIDLDIMFNGLSSLDPKMMMVVMIVISLIIFALSYLVSLKIINKKEF